MRCCVPVLRLLVVLTLPLALNLAAADSGLAAERGRTAASDDAARLEKRIDDLEKELNFYKALEQERRGAGEKLAAEQAVGVNKRIDDGLGRVGDVSTTVTLLGAFITILLFGIGIFAYFGAGKQAKKEAKEWLSDNRKKHDDDLKKWINGCKLDFENTISELTKKLEGRIGQKIQQASNKLQCFDDDLKGMLARAQQSIGKYGDLTLSDKDVKALDDAVDKLKGEDERCFTYTDWMLKAYSAFKDDNYKEAIFCFDNVINDISCPGTVVEDAIYAKSVAIRRNIGEFNQLSLNCFQGERRRRSEYEYIDKVIMKGVDLGKIGDTVDARVIFSRLVSCYGKSDDQNIQVLLARAYNGIGMSDLLTAKQQWIDFDKRVKRLKASINNFDISLLSANREVRQLSMGNKAYALFLLDKKKEAKEDLMDMLSQEMQKPYEGEFNEVRRHPVPEDEAFRALLDELWAQVKPTLPAAMGGTADGPGDTQAGDKGDSQAHHDKG